jgi:hypothetical protein
MSFSSESVLALPLAIEILRGLSMINLNLVESISAKSLSLISTFLAKQDNYVMIFIKNCFQFTILVLLSSNVIMTFFLLFSKQCRICERRKNKEKML